MPVGDLGSAGSVWIDHHEFGAIAACFLDEGPQVNVIAMDIRGPGNDVTGMAEVFRVRAELLSIDRHQGIAAGSCADGAIEPRGAQPMKEPAIHGPIAQHTHVPGIGVGQDGLRTMLLCDRAQAFRDQLECLVPPNRFEDLRLAAVGAFSLLARRAGAA